MTDPIENPEQLSVGNGAVVVALVIAMEEAGVLSSARYRDLLSAIWIGMPQELALGDAGAVIEQVLDRLEARADAECCPAA